MTGVIGNDIHLLEEYTLSHGRQNTDKSDTGERSQRHILFIYFIFPSLLA